jgi:hypothetical protein
LRFFRGGSNDPILGTNFAPMLRSWVMRQGNDELRLKRDLKSVEAFGTLATLYACETNPAVDFEVSAE